MTGDPPSRKFTQRLDRLLEICRDLSSTLDLAQLLQKITHVAKEATESESASILLLDQQSGQLRFEAMSGLSPEELPDIAVPLDSSVAGWVFSNREVLLVQDASIEPRVFRHVDKSLNFQTRSLLAVPLMFNRDPIGVLEAVNKMGNAHYTQEDSHVLETLAAQAAVAIENARLVRAQEQSRAEIIRFDRMKSEFLAISSHELRTPLGLVLGHATYLREITPAKYHEQVESIIRSANRLKEIIEDMSRIAHQEQGKSRVRRAPFSISQLLEDLSQRFEGEAQENGIMMELDLPGGDLLMIDGEREKIEVALANVVENALTFTDKGGQVGLKAEHSKDQVNVYVADDGIGIPESDLDRVFDRFYQVETHLTRKHGGMGLGLSIAKAMVEMHGGHIWCESKEDVGSLFCVELPVGDGSGS